jgi:hypothetical protein
MLVVLKDVLPMLFIQGAIAQGARGIGLRGRWIIISREQRQMLYRNLCTRLVESIG